MADLSSPSSSASFNENENPRLDSTRLLVTSINECILDLIANAKTWVSVKQKCISKLDIQKQNLFELSEHSVLSNLYWGIETIEAAIQSKRVEEKISRLRNSERMLQMPALLDEHGTTAGISNNFLISFSYFYLAIVSNLQGDTWQSALHFLQSLSVSPGLVRAEIAPEICESLFPLCNISELQEMDKDNINEDIGEIARRYKYRLTFYQVMFYGDILLTHSGCKDMTARAQHSEYHRYGTSGAAKPSMSDNLLTSQAYCKEDELNNIIDKSKASGNIQEIQDPYNASQYLDWVPKSHHCSNFEGNTSVRCLQDMLKDSQSATSGSTYDSREDTFMELMAENQSTTEAASLKEENEAYITKLVSATSPNFIGDLNLPVLECMTKESNATWNAHMEDTSSPKSLDHELLVFGERESLILTRKNQPSFTGMTMNFHTQLCNQAHLSSERASKKDSWQALEDMIAKRCLLEVLENFDEDYAVEVTNIYEMLNEKRGIRYALLKDVILDQLVVAISTSREENVIRASVSMLTTIISANRSALEDVKKKGLQLSNLASALKQNVEEAAILIYLIKPSPMEIKSLELLPALVNVVSTSMSYKGRPTSLQLTPPAASLMIIEVLVTAFDYATNNMHLAAISSPHVLRGLLRVAQNRNRGEFISLATILVKCMRFDGKSRKYISQLTQVAPFIHLLQSDDKGPRSIALEFLHEILRIPRSMAIKMLQQIQEEASMDIMETLMLCIQQLQSDNQLLAANILLQLNALEYPSGNSAFNEDAMEALLEAATCIKDSSMQLLSTFILSNLGGTYSWTGEPYTVAWLVKRAGLTSLCHRNMIRNIDWSDECLQDAGIDRWCSKMARIIIDIGKPVFHALGKGLNSKIKMVSRECLTAIAWLSFEVAKSPDNIRYSACEILLDEIKELLHPGLELEERLLACLCIYNFVSGKGIQKLIHFSEGVRESLRRFSHVTWMADELHKVTDYLGQKSRISCVHTQILEMHQSRSGAVTALIYYKGLLCSGYSDGSIKVWEVRGQSATLLWDIKEHRNAVTCFSLFQPGESLLSGSIDKTIRIWQISESKFECTEVITTKEAIKKLDTYKKLIFVVTKGHKMKLLDSSKTLRAVSKGKSVKCVTVAQEKIYVGCTDSSIKEITITNNREKEIKAPMRSWRIQNKPINSIIVYKDWLYSTSSNVEGSYIKDLRRHYEARMSINAEKGANILATGVVEDFIYLNRSSSASTLQIWLRRTQQRVGRLSAGSKITSLLTANDIVFCGTEAGVIKGWIPL